MTFICETITEAMARQPKQELQIDLSTAGRMHIGEVSK